MTAALARQTASAPETASITVSEQSRLALFPLVCGHLKGDDYSVLRVGCPRLKVLATTRLGVEAIRLLKKGRTVGEVSRAMSAKCADAKQAIELQPLVAALLQGGMVRRIDGNMIDPERPRLSWLVRHHLQYRVLITSRGLTGALIRCLPPQAAHRILFFWKWRWKGRKARHSAGEARKNFEHAFGMYAPPDRIEAAATAWSAEQIRSGIDGDFFHHMPRRKLVRWLQSSVEFQGLEHIEAAQRQGRGVILCGLHFTSVYLLVPILWLKGYSFTGAGSPRSGWVRNEPVIHLQDSSGAGTVRWYTKADFRGAVEMLKALQRGEAVLGFADGHLQRDRTALAHYGHRAAMHPAATSHVSLLGRRVAANTGIAWFHLQSGAPVVPVKLLRKCGSRLRVIVEPALDLAEKKDLQSVTRAIYGALEKDLYLDPALWSYWDRLQQMEA